MIEKGISFGTRTYDCLVYKKEMNFFNRVTRPSVHKWQRARAGGLDACYDCAAEVRLPKMYNEIWRPGASRRRTSARN